MYILIYIYVDLWCTNKHKCILKYGYIHSWNVSEVTDMSKLFYRKYYFNDNISKWNVSNVIDMSCMFYNAFKYNKPFHNQI